jgi:hypothetical protein
MTPGIFVARQLPYRLTAVIWSIEINPSLPVFQTRLSHYKEFFRIPLQVSTFPLNFELQSTFKMKDSQDYIRDLAEMRSMMERSTKFLSLAGLAGVLAGIYALAGAYIAYQVLGFDPSKETYNPATTSAVSSDLLQLIALALVVLVLAVGTAAVLSTRKAKKNGERIWNATAKRLLINMSVPLVAGGLLILILIAKGLIGLVAPFTLIFYGLALYNVSKYTYEEVRSLGLLQIAFGLLAAYFSEYAVWFWAAGFGLLHIIYGVYMHYRYER